jgi:hypothetical protein
MMRALAIAIFAEHRICDARLKRIAPAPAADTIAASVKMRPGNYARRTILPGRKTKARRLPGFLVFAFDRSISRLPYFASLAI